MDKRLKIHRQIIFAITLIFTMLSTTNAQTTMNQQYLTARQLHLAACACLEAQGDMQRLDTAINKALDEGVTINELKEAFSQLYAYTGFPRSLNALNQLKATLETRKSRGITDTEGKPWQRPDIWNDAQATLKRGTEVQTRLCGGVPYHLDFSPQNDYYLKAHLFGDIFAGDLLSDADREIVTIAALSGMKGVEKQLASHKRGAVAMGNTPQQVEQLCQYLNENILSERDFEYWPQGQPNNAYAKYFIGNSYVAPIHPKNLSTDTPTQQGYVNVTFEPGCRNNWHIHHGAHQILICVSGNGWYQEWGKPAIALKPGDIIDIPEGVKHWHGAQHNSWFQHPATYANTKEEHSNEWLEPVSDEQYNQLSE